MKTATALIVLLYLALGYSAFGLSPAERTIVEQMRNKLVEAHEVDLKKDATITTLTDTLTLQASESVALTQALRTKDAEVKAVVSERDGLKDQVAGLLKNVEELKSDLNNEREKVKAAKLEAKQNARERDVLVFAFAIAFSALAVRIFGPMAAAAFPQYSFLTGPAIAIGGIAGGYAIGRVALRYLSHLIP